MRSGKVGKRSGTCVDAGVGGRDPELRLDEFGDEGDESGDDGALGRVGEAHEQEGHVAQDPHGRLGELCERNTSVRNSAEPH